MTLEVDEDREQPERPHSMPGVVTLLVATIGVAVADHLSAAYRLGAERAGVRDPQPVDLTQLDRRLARQQQFLESGFATDVLRRLESAQDADEIDEAFEVLESRAAMYADAAWSMYQAGFKDLGREGQLVDFAGPDDEKSCAGCQDAVERGPYVLELAPEPGGQDCLSHCRHELIPLTNGEIEQAG